MLNLVKANHGGFARAASVAPVNSFLRHVASAPNMLNVRSSDQSRFDTSSIARIQPRYEPDRSRHLWDVPRQLKMSAVDAECLEALLERAFNLDSPMTPASDLRTDVDFKKRKRDSDAPPAVLPPTHDMPSSEADKILFEKGDRAFTGFWRDKIQVRPGDNRRHIPLVAVMKAMLQKVALEAKKNGDAEKLEARFDAFIETMTGSSHGPQKQLNGKARQILGILTNLRSHIFLGHGPVNQIIGSLSDNLEQTESRTVKKINDCKTVEALALFMSDWSARFQLKFKGEVDDCELLLDHEDIRSFDRDQIIQHYRCQFEEITSCLTAQNYPELESFQLEARALVKNLRDSYATDISSAGDAEVRRWQNTGWLHCHQQMLLLGEKPSLKGLSKVLSEVVELEQEFAALVSKVLNKQGLSTTPDLFLMKNAARLNGEALRPVRQALAALLQEPEIGAE